MKYAIIIMAGMAFGTTLADAQTHSEKKNNSSHTSKTSAKNSSVNSKQSSLASGTAVHGGKLVSRFHGKHDYTPGSPVGTGGAGGSTMSGSPQGSAEENAVGNKASNELGKRGNSATKNNPRANKKGH